MKDLEEDGQQKRIKKLSNKFPVQNINGLRRRVLISKNDSDDELSADQEALATNTVGNKVGQAKD